MTRSRQGSVRSNRRRSETARVPTPRESELSPSTRPQPAWLSRLLPFIIAAVVLGAGLPTIRNAFVDLDDAPYISEKPASDGLTRQAVLFAFTSVRPMYWHPVAWLSHELDTDLFGSAPGGHHFTSALLHAFAAAVLYLVLTRLGAGMVPAVLGSLLWALHPLRVESFAWIAERKDVLCAVFFFAAVAFYLQYANQPSRKLYAAWTCCGLLALMSKPTAVSLTIVLFLFDFWPQRRQASLVRLALEKIPLAASAAAVTFLAVKGQSQAMSLAPVASLPIRLANAALSCVRYLGKMAWPLDLGCFYPFHPEVAIRWGIPSAVLLLAVTTFALQQRRRRPWLLVGWSWFLITLLPNSGIVQAGRQAMADRFTELPMVGIVIIMVWAVSEWAGASTWRRRAAALVTCAMLIVLALLTIRQISYWKDSETLFLRAITVEDSDYIRDNLATNLIQRGRLGEAESHLLAAIHLAPDAYPHHNNLAILYGRMGRPQQALAEAKIASSLVPQNQSVAETLALVLLGIGDYPAAMQNFDHAVQLGSDPATLAPLMNDTGVSLAKKGMLREAEPLLRKAVQYDPQLADAQYNLVHDLAAQGKSDEARAALEAAIKATGFKSEYQDFLQPKPGPSR